MRRARAHTRGHPCPRWGCSRRALALALALLPPCRSAEDDSQPEPPSFQFSDDSDAESQGAPLPGGELANLPADAASGKAGGEVLSVPWRPGPEEYTVQGGPDGASTLSLYPAEGPVRVSIGGELADSLRQKDWTWTLVELYDHASPTCWNAVPAVTGVARAFQHAQNLRVTSMNCHAQVNAETCLYLELLAEVADYPALLLCREADATGEKAPVLPSSAKDLKKNLDGEQLAAFEGLSQCLERYEQDEREAYLSAQGLAEWVSAKTGLEATDVHVLNSGADLARLGRPVVDGAPFAPGWPLDSKEGEPGTPRFSPEQRWNDAIQGFAEAVYYNAHRPGRLEEAVAMARFLSNALPGEELLEVASTRAVAGLGELADALEHVDASGGIHMVQKQIHSAVSAWTEAYDIADPRDAFDALTNAEIARFHTCTGATGAAWALLHVTATAVAARGMSGQPLLSEKPGRLGGDGDLAGAQAGLEDFVRHFVGGFLSCRHCRTEFLARLDACAYGNCHISDFRQLALWLWRAHNNISLEQAAREEAKVDRRWPGYQDCPACWSREVAQDGHRPSASADRSRRLTADVEKLDAVFDTGHVFWHMVATYVGVRRMTFEVADLPPDEQERVKGLLGGDEPPAADRPPAADEPSAAPPESASIENCEDSKLFVDERMDTCEDWAPFDCARAAEDWGFTPRGEQELLQNCGRSCGVCTPEPAHFGHTLVGATALCVIVAAVCCYLGGGGSSTQRYARQLDESRTPRILPPQQSTTTMPADDEEDPAQE